jgi:hypothetical protein
VLRGHSRYVADCASSGVHATLFVSGINERRYALLFRRGRDLLPPLDVGVIGGKLALSCHDGAAMLTRKSDDRIARWRCDAKHCVQSLSDRMPLMKHALVTAAPLGDAMAMAWLAPGEPLRLRVAAAADLDDAPDRMLFDDEPHGGIEPVAMRMLSADGLAVLLLQDAGNRVYALRLHDDEPTPVRVVR